MKTLQEYVNESLVSKLKEKIINKFKSIIIKIITKANQVPEIQKMVSKVLTDKDFNNCKNSKEIFNVLSKKISDKDVNSISNSLNKMFKSDNNAKLSTEENKLVQQQVVKEDYDKGEGSSFFDKHPNFTMLFGLLLAYVIGPITGVSGTFNDSPKTVVCGLIMVIAGAILFFVGDSKGNEQLEKMMDAREKALHDFKNNKVVDDIANTEEFKKSMATSNGSDAYGKSFGFDRHGDYMCINGEWLDSGDIAAGMMD